jgi:hypothetical protein
MMFIWRGAGFLVPLFALGALMTAQAAVNAAFADPEYYRMHEWPKLVGLSVGAALIWTVGRVLNRRQERPYSTFFWIPMEYWAIAFVVVGVALSLFNR